MNKCYKCRISAVFRKKDAATVKDVIECLHQAVCQTTLLIKYKFVEDVHGQTNNDSPFTIDEKVFSYAYNAVVDPLNQSSRNPRNPEAIVQRQKWRDAYNRMMDGKVHDFSKVKDYSISHMVSLTGRQYISNVLTNVRYHFRAYVSKCLRAVVQQKAVSLWRMKRFSDLPSQARAFWKKQAWLASQDVLLFRSGDTMKCDPVLHSIVERAKSKVVPALPEALLLRSAKQKADLIDVDLDNEDRVMVYLVYMVRMNRFLQAIGEPMLSPLPVKVSFIPSHYTIDTSSLCHIFMDVKRLKSFSRYFAHSVRGGFELPKLTKSNVCSSLQTLLPGRNVTRKDEERYMDAIWSYCCRLKRAARSFRPLRVSSNHPEMKFDHSVSTDGYAISFLVTNRTIRGRKTYKSTFRSRKATDRAHGDEEFYRLSYDNASQFKELLEDRFLKLGGDPGKGGLLHLTDAAYDSPVCKKTLRYTKGQRDLDTLRLTRSKRLRSGSSAARMIEESEFRKCSSKTCYPDKLREYVSVRLRHFDLMQSTYSKQLMFRWSRFLAWIGRNYSVDRFIKRIKEVYGSVDRQNTDKKNNDDMIVIFYGDWGRQPNLKHQAPTPGIGLRRLIHAAHGITTITVHESYTSSYCPKCEHPVTKVKNCGHHLLHCKNPRCNVLWQRDSLGAANILAKALFLLKFQVPHFLLGA